MAKKARANRKPNRSDKFSPVQNEALYQAMQEKRRSSAAQPHVAVADKGTRRQKKIDAIKQEW